MITNDENNFIPVNDYKKIYDHHLLEIQAPESGCDKWFSILCETLSRIGFPKREDGVLKLYQVVHCLHKQGRYFLVHYASNEELRYGNDFKLSEKQQKLLSAVAERLQNWGQLSIVDVDKVKECSPSDMGKAIIVKHSNTQFVKASHTKIGIPPKNNDEVKSV